MRYSDDIIEEVRMKNDIVDAVSYTHLTLPTTPSDAEQAGMYLIL